METAKATASPAWRHIIVIVIVAITLMWESLQTWLGTDWQSWKLATFLFLHSQHQAHS